MTHLVKRPTPVAASSVHERPPAPLEAFDLEYSFGPSFKLGPLNVKCEHAQITHLQGAPGAGKSTLLALLAGRMPWDAGYLLSDQRRVDLKSAQSARLWRRRVSFMPDRPALPMRRSLRELLELSLVARQIRGHEVKQETLRVLSELGLLSLSRLPLQALSMAQYRLAQVALATCGHLDLVLLDEPFAHLPEKDAFELRNYLKSFAQRGSALLISSHNASILEGVAHASIELQQGQLRGGLR
jgi:ABC-type multidrug transport system ATPase subunit